MQNNEGLLLFYFADFIKNCVYYSKNHDAICIAMQEENTLLCFDIFCSRDVCMKKVLAEVAMPGTQSVTFGFTPKETESCECAQIKGEDTLFVLSGKENIFESNQVIFPLLSHA